MKICFVAPTNYGKTTAAKILEKNFNSKNIKIAEPLYELQDYFYDFIGKKIGDKQDGELLQFLGIKIRKESPKFLLNYFYENLINSFNEIITNDDCRPPDYMFLKELGFKFVKINGFRRDREDHTKADINSKIEWQSEISCDYEVDNFGSLEEYEINLIKLLNEIKEERRLKYVK